jgi:hypothetical protein
MKKIGRNEPCPCGSGKKYKKCCYPKTEFPIGDEDWTVDFDPSEDMHDILEAPGAKVEFFGDSLPLKEHYAEEVASSIVLMGNIPKAIKHLRIEHGLSVKEIEIGVNHIVETEKAGGNTQAEIDFKDWKKYAEGIND